MISETKLNPFKWNDPFGKYFLSSEKFGLNLKHLVVGIAVYIMPPNNDPIKFPNPKDIESKAP